MRFEEFLGDETKPVGMDIDFDGSCQLCHEYVDKAEYFPVEKILRWVCSSNHISFVQDFKL